MASATAVTALVSAILTLSSIDHTCRYLLLLFRVSLLVQLPTSGRLCRYCTITKEAGARTPDAAIDVFEPCKQRLTKWIYSLRL